MAFENELKVASITACKNMYFITELTYLKYVN